MFRFLFPLAFALAACAPSEAVKDPADTGAPDTGDPAGDTDSGSDDTDGTDDTGSDDTGSGDTGSDDTASGDTGSGDTGSGDTGSGDTGPDGEALYQATCAACHGADGRGASGPDIVGEVADRADDSLVDIIRNGKDEMPPQEVTDAEAQAIVDYMRAAW